MIRFNLRTPEGDNQPLGRPGAFYVTDLGHRARFCPARWEGSRLVLDPTGDGP